MGIFWLDERLIFPPHRYANKEGILAVGGDLSLERLLLAYTNGIFPWYNEDEVIIWWSPHERYVLYLDEIKISRSLQKFIRKNTYRVTYDTVFERVISECRNIRMVEGTWITQGMLDAYIALHEDGIAHSVEVWQDDTLVGGLYGVSLGTVFCGESMFTIAPNASKIALLELCENLKKMGFRFVDCQVYTPNLEKFGARNVSREQYLRELELELNNQTKKGKWHFLNE